MALPSESRIYITAREGGSLLEVAGEIDISTEPELELLLLQADGVPELVIDLRSIRFCSARGLWLIDQWAREREVRGRPARLLMRPQEVRLLTLLKGNSKEESEPEARSESFATPSKGQGGFNPTRLVFGIEEDGILPTHLIESVNNAIAKGEPFIAFDLRSHQFISAKEVDLLSLAVAACARARVGVEIIGRVPVASEVKT